MPDNFSIFFLHVEFTFICYICYREKIRDTMFLANKASSSTSVGKAYR